MIGRVVGFIFGVAIAATGFGVWRPAAFAKFVDFSKVEMGDFGQYRTILAWLIMAVGTAVALAALQRPSLRPAKPAAALSLDDAEPGAHAELTPALFTFDQEAHYDGHTPADPHDHGHHNADHGEAHGHDDGHGHGEDHHAPAHAH